jgi:D-glycero-D-manno-heptose 1,7-bisphosphate phosphatase
VKKAVFLDRDGTINELVFNAGRNEYEPPHKKEDLRLFPYSIEALKKLAAGGYHLLLISNQPDAAKGKISIEDIKSVHMELHRIFTVNGVEFAEYYYCYHHPNGIVPEYTLKCDCRKPGKLFLNEAERKHGISFNRSWLIGDRDSDIQTADGLDVRTIQLEYEPSTSYRGKSSPDFIASDLEEAIGIILNHKE